VDTPINDPLSVFVLVLGPTAVMAVLGAALYLLRRKTKS
jgi:hypothetical protein